MSKEQEFLVKNLSAGKKLKYKIIDARHIGILSNGLNICETSDGTTITELNIENELIIGIGFEFNTESKKITSNYRIDFIKKNDSGYSLFTHKRNLTTTYMLPMLGNAILNVNNQNNGFSGYLINAYLSESLEELYVLYRYCNNDGQRIIEDSLSKINGFIKLTSPSPGLDLYEYKIQEEHILDPLYFIQGRYSKFSTELKLKITKFAMESILILPSNKRPKSSPRIVQVINRDLELVALMEKEWECKFDNIDLECKPKKCEEIWERQKN